MNNQEIAKVLNELVDTTIEICKQDTMTKDGYGTLMSLLTRLKNPVTQKNFVLLCIAKGYPKQTGMEVLNIMGL